MKEVLQKKQQELKEIITAWMRDNNRLELGETIVIEIRVKSAEPVEVEIKRDIDDMTLFELGGPSESRIYLLKKNGICTVGQIRNKTQKDLLKIRGIGKGSLRKLKNRLNKLGVKTDWMCKNIF
jgi:DNA-directed RNA polymerase alpha subunit